MTRVITRELARMCHRAVAEVDPDRPFDELGLASRDAVALAGYLESVTGRPLPPTLVWDFPTVSLLAWALSSSAQSAGPAPLVHRAASSPPLQLDDPVAIIGIGCRFPGGPAGSLDGPAEFWEFLCGGGDAIAEVDAARWAAFDDGSAATGEVLASVTRWAGTLGDIAGFDAAFFGIAPGEAAAMDPQQRILLEVCWESLEHAGLPPRSLRGSRTGVFTGISAAEYAHLTTSDLSQVDAWTATGAAASVAAGRVSYLLDLRGPSMAVDTACSSSLLAVHLAVASLRSGESDLALAGGVNLLLSPVITMTFDAGGGTSPDGQCRPFDAGANGMVRGEGCGVVVLKRLIDARRDGDRVLAVITGTAANSDGRSNGLVAPNAAAQRDLLRAAYAAAATRPDQVDYVEAHGTGTPLGDPIEARALGGVLGTARPPDRPLLIGSVKSNIGHLEVAAGMAGLIKTVLALSHRQIPPTLHFTEPGPHLPLDDFGLSVVSALADWPDNPWPPTAGVSAFGFSGTNVHLVLTADPQPEGANQPSRQRGGDGRPVMPGNGDADPSSSPDTFSRPDTSSSLPAARNGHVSSPGDGVSGSHAGVLDSGTSDQGSRAGSGQSVVPNGGRAAPGGSSAVAGDLSGGPGGRAGASGRQRIMLSGDAAAASCPLMFPLADLSAERIRRQAGRLADWLDDRPEGEPPLAHVASTLAARQGRGAHRVIVVTGDRAELLAALRGLAAGQPHAAVVSGQATVRAGQAPADSLPADAMPGQDGPGVAFVFSGYGSQWADMGLALAESEPVFADALAEAGELIGEASGLSLAKLIRDAEAMRQVQHAQPVLFGVQLALARLWQAHGIQPRAVIGHSMGEIAAAVVSGSLSPADGAHVITCRSRLLSRLAGSGTMALIGLPADEVTGLAADLPGVHLAVISSPTQCVVTGDSGQVEELARRVTARGASVRVLPAEGAGHSPQVDSLLGELTAQLDGIRGRIGRIRFYSTAHDDPRTSPACDPAYWAANVRQPVKLGPAITAAAADGLRGFVEISPHPMLTRALTETVRHETGADGVITGTLRRDAADAQAFHLQMARLAAGGLRLPASLPRTIIDLPPAPWQHVRHWADRSRRSAQAGHPLLGPHVELPGGTRHAWQATLTPDTLAGLTVPGSAASLFPLSAVGEMAVAAACEAWAISAHTLTITDLKLTRLIPVTPGALLATTLDETDELTSIGTARHGTIQIHTKDQSGPWLLTATAEVVAQESSGAGGVRGAAQDRLAPKVRVSGSGHGAAPTAAEVGVQGADGVGGAGSVTPGGTAEAGPQGSVAQDAVDAGRAHSVVQSAAAVEGRVGGSGPVFLTATAERGVAQKANSAGGVEPAGQGGLVAEDRVGSSGSGSLPHTAQVGVQDGAARQVAGAGGAESQVGRRLAADSASGVDPSVGSGDRGGLVAGQGSDAEGGSRAEWRDGAGGGGASCGDGASRASGGLETAAGGLRVVSVPAARMARGQCVPAGVLAGCLAGACGADQVPVGIGRLRVLGAAAGGGECAVVCGEAGEGFELRLTDGGGGVVLDVSGVRVAGVSAADVPVSYGEKLFERGWRELDVPEAPGLATRRWVVLGVPAAAAAHVTTLAEGLVAGLEAAGNEASVVTTGPDLAMSDLDVPDLAEPDPADGVALAGVVLLLPEPATVAGGEGLVLDVVRLAAILAGRPGPTPRLWMVTAGAAAVRPGDTGKPGLAALRGLVRVLGLERPGLRATVADLDPEAGPGEAAAALAAELIADSAEDEVAWREGTRLVARLVRPGDGSGLAADDQAAGRYRAGLVGAEDGSGVVAGSVGGQAAEWDRAGVVGAQGGSGVAGAGLAGGGGRVRSEAAGAVEKRAGGMGGLGRRRRVVLPGAAYVVTGGYGALGLVVARWLAERGAGRIVLNGRNGPPAEARAVLDEIDAVGGRIVVVTGDVAEPGVAERLVAAACRGGMPLRGVVHAAGLPADALIGDVTASDLARVWTPKVAGAWRLHEAIEGANGSATGGAGLDWFVLFSSAAALLGSPGQAVYATANAWLDAFAAWRRAQGLAAMAVNWGLWSVGGQGAGGALRGLGMIGADEGAVALERAIMDGWTAVGVVRLDPATAIAAYPEIAGLPYFGSLTGDDADARAGLGDWPGSAALRAAEPGRRRRLADQRVLAQVAAVIGVPPEAVADDLPLTDAGADSLAAQRICNLLEHDLGVIIEPAALLGGTTLAQLRERVAAKLGVTGDAGSATPDRSAALRWPGAGGPVAVGGEPGGAAEGLAGRSAALRRSVEGDAVVAGGEPGGAADGLASRPVALGSPAAGDPVVVGSEPRGAAEGLADGRAALGWSAAGEPVAAGTRPRGAAEGFAGRLGVLGRSVDGDAVVERGEPGSAAERLVDRSAAFDWAASGAPVAVGIEPRDAAERLVARVVGEVLGVMPGVTDDLSAIGLPPSVKVLISQRLSAEVGRHIDADGLFATPTIEAAAGLVREADEAEVEGVVRLIRAGGEAPPVLLAHPAGGTTGVYKALASMLGGERAVFGLERLEGALERRAARYAEAILGRFPGGGWVLGGWSFGGVLGYETARQLAAAGHRVGQVVLLDAALPLPIPAGTESEVLAHRFAAFAGYLTATYGKEVPLSAEELLGLAEEAQLALLTERMGAAGLTGVLSPAILRHQIESHTDTRTLERYQPQGYDGPVQLYRADRETPWAVRDQRYEIISESRGWDALCSSLTVAAVDCHHLNLLDPPAVHSVAAHLRALLSSQGGPS